MPRRSTRTEFSPTARGVPESIRTHPQTRHNARLALHRLSQDPRNRGGADQTEWLIDLVRILGLQLTEADRRAGISYGHGEDDPEGGVSDAGSGEGGSPSRIGTR